MDPLDPLTEIISSGQAFSPAIALEKIIWVFIGFFFIGAISTSIANGLRNRNGVTKNIFFQDIPDSKKKEKSSKQFSGEEK